MIDNPRDRSAAEAISTHYKVAIKHEVGDYNRPFVGGLVEGMIRNDIIEKYTDYKCSKGYVFDPDSGEKSPELDGVIHQGNVYGSDPAVVKIDDVKGAIEAKASAQQGHYDISMPDRMEFLGEIPIFFVGLFRYRPESFIGENGEETTFVFGDRAGDGADDMVRPGEVDRLLEAIRDKCAD